MGLSASLSIAAFWAAISSVDWLQGLAEKLPILSAAAVPLVSLVCLYGCGQIIRQKVHPSYLMLFGPALFMTSLFSIMICSAVYGVLFDEKHQSGFILVLISISIASVAIMPSIAELGEKKQTLLSK